ncbi:hypothetical protein, partial [Shigella sp. FC1967]|uniref:hypothetical protein n=1 Tax=Shigella sp. FC1967 TaxID=1898041 RepID=UPI00336AB6FC
RRWLRSRPRQIFSWFRHYRYMSRLASVTCNANKTPGIKKRPAIAGPLVHVRGYYLGVVMLFFFLSLMVEIQTAASDDSEKYEQPQHA